MEWRENIFCLILFGLVYCRKSVVRGGVGVGIGVGVGKSVTVLPRVIAV